MGNRWKQSGIRGDIRPVTHEEGQVTWNKRRVIFQNKTWNSQDKKPRTRHPLPQCDSKIENCRQQIPLTPLDISISTNIPHLLNQFKPTSLLSLTKTISQMRLSSTLLDTISTTLLKEVPGRVGHKIPLHYKQLCGFFFSPSFNDALIQPLLKTSNFFFIPHFRKTNFLTGQAIYGHNIQSHVIASFFTTVSMTRRRVLFNPAFCIWSQKRESSEDLNTVVFALMSIQLEYCNILHSNISQTSLHCLNLVQDAATSFVIGSRK